MKYTREHRTFGLMSNSNDIEEFIGLALRELFFSIYYIIRDHYCGENNLRLGRPLRQSQLWKIVRLGY